MQVSHQNLAFIASARGDEETTTTSTSANSGYSILTLPGSLPLCLILSSKNSLPLTLWFALSCLSQHQSLPVNMPNSYPPFQQMVLIASSPQS